MAEEKKNIQKLTDEELDQVAGGNPLEFYNMCKAIYANKNIFDHMNPKAQTAINKILSGRRYNTSSMDNIIDSLKTMGVFKSLTVNTYGSNTGTTGDGHSVSGAEIEDVVRNFGQ